MNRKFTKEFKGTYYIKGKSIFVVLCYIFTNKVQTSKKIFDSPCDVKQNEA